jgi:hypothetical protein
MPSDDATRHRAEPAVAGDAALPWPATPPTIAPLMHPLASAGDAKASADRQAVAKIVFMVLL